MCTPQPEQHVMNLVQKFATGAEEWRCPACGRRFIMQWPPNYKKIMLEVGDENAVHSGSSTNLSIEKPPVASLDADALSEDPWLTPWMDWAQRTNFQQRWDSQS